MGSCCGRASETHVSKTHELEHAEVPVYYVDDVNVECTVGAAIIPASDKDDYQTAVVISNSVECSSNDYVDTIVQKSTFCKRSASSTIAGRGADLNDKPPVALLEESKVKSSYNESDIRGEVSHLVGHTSHSTTALSSGGPVNATNVSDSSADKATPERHEISADAGAALMGNGVEDGKEESSTSAYFSDPGSPVADVKDLGNPPEECEMEAEVQEQLDGASASKTSEDDAHEEGEERDAELEKVDSKSVIDDASVKNRAGMFGGWDNTTDEETSVGRNRMTLAEATRVEGITFDALNVAPSESKRIHKVEYPQISFDNHYSSLDDKTENDSFMARLNDVGDYVIKGNSADAGVVYRDISTGQRYRDGDFPVLQAAAQVASKTHENVSEFDFAAADTDQVAEFGETDANHFSNDAVVVTPDHGPLGATHKGNVLTWGSSSSNLSSTMGIREDETEVIKVLQDAETYNLYLNTSQGSDIGSERHRLTMIFSPTEGPEITESVGGVFGKGNPRQREIPEEMTLTGHVTASEKSTEWYVGKKNEQAGLEHRRYVDASNLNDRTEEAPRRPALQRQRPPVIISPPPVTPHEADVI